MPEPRYSGAYQPKYDQEAMEEAGEVAGMAKGGSSTKVSTQPVTVGAILNEVMKVVEEKEEPRRGGAYAAKDMIAVDTKAAVDKLCHGKCPRVWEEYEKCEARIEKKARHVHARGLGAFLATAALT
jgi:hypothetical protein